MADHNMLWLHRFGGWTKNTVMDQWGTPAAVIAALALIGILWRFAYWKGTVDEHRKAVDGSLGSIKAILDEIRDDIKKIFRALPAKSVEAGSPLRLTDFGEQIAQHLNAYEWASKHAPTLLHLLSNMQDFEIDAFSDNHVRSEILPSSAWKPKIAACTYHLGTNENEVANVLRVVLREELLREHPPGP